MQSFHVIGSDQFLVFDLEKHSFRMRISFAFVHISHIYIQIESIRWLRAQNGLLANVCKSFWHSSRRAYLVNIAPEGKLAGNIQFQPASTECKTWFSGWLGTVYDKAVTCDCCQRLERYVTIRWSWPGAHCWT